MVGGVPGHVGVGPRRQRIDLDHAPALVEGHDGGGLAGGGVHPLEAGHPGVLAGQRLLERAHLAELTALGAAARPLLGPGHRLGHPQVEVVAGPHRLHVGQRFGKVGPGVQEHHFDGGVDPHGDVDEDGVLEGGGHGQLRPEPLDRPGHDLAGRGRLEGPVALVELGFAILPPPACCPRCSPSPSSPVSDASGAGLAHRDLDRPVPVGRAVRRPPTTIHD